jgi:hypothetical protein
VISCPMQTHALKSGLAVALVLSAAALAGNAPVSDTTAADALYVPTPVPFPRRCSVARADCLGQVRGARTNVKPGFALGTHVGSCQRAAQDACKRSRGSSRVASAAWATGLR